MSTTAASSSNVAEQHPLSPPPDPQTSTHHQPSPSPRSQYRGGRGSHSLTRSPFMSDSPENYASSFSATQTSPAHTSLARTASSSGSLSSPPSSFAMSAQASQQPTTSTNSFPTPASSVSGQLAAGIPEDVDPARKDVAANQVPKQEGETVVKSEEDQDPMDVDAPESHKDVAGPENAAGESKMMDSAMDLDQPKQASDAGNQSLESLQTDMGQAFHLCKTSYTKSGPDPSLDLLSLYGLGPVAASVARTDPVTGEKINRLRKSYEGKIKPLGLAGRNKPMKHEPGAPESLRQLTMWPEEEWQNQKVYGKEIKVAEPDSNAHKMQMRAMKFEPGPVPNNEYWEDVLGHEKPPKRGSTPSAEPPSKKPSVSAPVFRPQGQTNGTPTATTPRPGSGRPKRTGKKRSYTDDSFVGYGDGFPEDDDLDGDLYSNSEAGSSKKKRKKDHVSGVSSFQNQGGSYGVGMFGVGAR